jgi:hypothetical protein
MAVEPGDIVGKGGTPLGLGKVSKKQKKEMTRAMEQVNDLLKEMVTDSMLLSLKIASCGCVHKDGCGVYKEAQKMAVVLDKINSLKAK